MKTSLVGVLILFGTLAASAGCGDDDRVPGDVTDTDVDGGSRDGSAGEDGGAVTGDLVDHPRSSSGTTELSYNFLDTVTFETATPPDPYTETVSVTPNADLTQLTIELGVCSGTGNYTETNDSGEQLYEMDLETADCSIMVNGEIVDMVYSGGRIYWGPEGIRTFFSGEGTITNSSSLVLVEHGP